MSFRAAFHATVASLILSATGALAAETIPLSPSWNIQPTGKAGSSGELLFRMTSADGSDPVEVAVTVLSGSNEMQVARDIRETLAAHLQPGRFDVRLGEGANVLISDRHSRPAFSLELVDSGVQDLRVSVKSVAPVAPPTVPQQAAPATPPTSTPAAAPGNGMAPGNAAPEITPAPTKGSVPATPTPNHTPATPENSPTTPAPESTPDSSPPGTTTAPAKGAPPAPPGSAPPPTTSAPSTPPL